MFKVLMYKALAVLTGFILTVTGAITAPPGSNDGGLLTDYETCKNVIFIIGDGMGFNSIGMAQERLGTELTSFDRFTLKGESKTASAIINFTDSAAGGTALATGVRVALKTVGVYPTDINAEKSYPMNLCELAVSLGKSAGIVTTSETTDATPADFSAHVAHRDEWEKISEQQMNGPLTLLWGYRNSKINTDDYRAKGFEVLTEKEQLDALDTENCGRTFGQFAYGLHIDGYDDNVPALAELTEKALAVLDNNENGFFLMLEGAHIDKASDDRDADEMAIVTASFDRAVNTALNYADANPGTVVILTADHETGGIKKTASGHYYYTTSQHTNANVPLFIYGSDDFIVDGEIIENREVGRRTACIMGEKNFPIEVAAGK